MGASQMRLDQARDAVKAEDARATGLQNRGAVLAAAAGLVIGIALTVGRSLFLREIDETPFGSLFVLTLLALLVAAAFAGLALWPPGSAAASVTDIAALSDPKQPTTPKEQAEVLIDALADQLSTSRDDNEGTAKQLRRGLGLLAAGAVGTAVLGTTLAFSDLEPRERAISPQANPIARGEKPLAGRSEPRRRAR